MWVQEGNDQKENEYTTTSSLFARLYSRKSKQSVTKMVIPMNIPASKRFKLEREFHKNKNQDKSIQYNIQSSPDEKDPSPPARSQSPDISLTTPTSSPAVSPAVFLKNMKRRNNTTNNADDAEMDILNDVDDIGYDIHFDHEGSMDDHDYDAITSNFQDLQIVGKKLDFQTTSMDICNDNQTDDDRDIYVAKMEFDGIDIKSSKQWNECLNYTKNNNLLIVELYSNIFGAANVLYPFIDEIIYKNGKNKTKFVRLSICKLNEINEIKETIQNVSEYTSSPIPIYIFIKNEIKIDELRGSQIGKFEQLIIKNVVTIKRPQSATIKYKSICNKNNKNNKRPFSASSICNKENNQNISNQYTSKFTSTSQSISTSTSTSTGKSKIENIRNLIKNLNLKDNRLNATKLNKRSFGTST